MFSLSTNATARTFKQALPGYVFEFPRDHCSHDDFKTEWWYFTGHISTQSGAKFGYELTFFRSALDLDIAKKDSPWNLQNIYFTHFAVTDPDGKTFFYKEKLNRPGVEVANARSDVCNVYNELWSLQQLGDDFVLKADSPEYSINLILTAAKKPAIHGTNGVSQKASCKGCASHYYSMTRLKTRGTLYKNQKPLRVQGLSWMDHEFGSSQLSKEQIGWDWFSVQLDNNVELMLYMLRREDGSIDPNSSGTIIGADGSVRHLTLAEFSTRSFSTWKSPTSKGEYPLDWQVTVPSLSLDLRVKPLMLNQELAKTRSTGVTYWEGDCDVIGTYEGKPVKGDAYVELTGYAEKFRQDI